MADALQVKKTSKHGILELWEMQLDGYTGEIHCALPGLEFLIPPYPVHEIRKNKKTFKLDPSSVHIFSGAEGHTEQFMNAKASLKAIVVAPKYVTEFCEPLSIQAEEIDFNPGELAEDHGLTNPIHLLANLADPHMDASAFSVDCMTSEILVSALVHQKHSCTEKMARDISSGYFPGTLPRIKSVIQKNIENPNFDLDMLARESGLSKFHLIRVFKKSVGISPAKYLNQIKMDLAKHWLLKSKKSVLSIAMDLGFSDLSTFNMAFKKATAFSPSGFRLRY
jgi:AraC-like DNA-binding protein